MSRFRFARTLAFCLTTSGLLAMAGCAVQQPGLNSAQIAQIVASPDRIEADRINDRRRKPEQMLAFIAPRPGMTALDLSAGGGYTSELLARSVGPRGVVYGQSMPRNPDNPPPRPAAPEGASAPVAPPAANAPPRPPMRPSPVALAERDAALKASGAQSARIVAVVQPFETPIPPGVADGSLDLVTLMFNYHDLGFLKVDRDRMNQAVFRALKPGGSYVIADHAGRPGTGISESGTLHRIEEAFLQREVEAAGFKFSASADFLRNPNDPRDRNTPEPPQPKDDFVLKFVKP
jgi:predicted methyltransferase